MPAGYKVLNSVYWRNAHFTFKGGHYFRVRMSQREREVLARHPDLVSLDASNGEVTGPCVARPTWFAPKGLPSYQVFTWRDDRANQRIDHPGPSQRRGLLLRL